MIPLRFLEPQIINNLTSNSEKDFLSARMGKELNDSKINITDIVDSLTDSSNSAKSKPLSAYQGYLLKQEIDTKSSVILDSNMSDSSENPVQNKIIKSYIDTKISDLVNSAPNTLDTLKELSDALGSDPNFATTVSTQLGNKVDKETGKTLTSNDFTDTLKNKLESINDSSTTDKGIAQLATIDDILSGNNTKIMTPSLSSTMFTMDYEFTTFNSDNNPTTIVYSDGTTISLSYREDGQLDYYTSQGYKVQYNYTNDNIFKGITTTKIS